MVTTTKKKRHKFQKRHYIAVANCISNTVFTDDLVDKLGQMFKEDNPSFDIVKFLNHCGYHNLASWYASK